ncbi:MAG: hypothetical protein AB7O28_26650 [Vicinamibacterales bacterium]
MMHALRRRALAVAAAVLCAGALLHAQPAAVPQALLARAGITTAPLASCGGEFRPGLAGDFAVAVPGRYLVVLSEGRTEPLAEFSGAPDLACHTPRDADRLNDAIAKSDTMNGRITAEWDGHVVCGFIEPTVAVCWQYAPEQRRFVRIGGWTT